jgi:hypothetical protein
LKYFRFGIVKKLQEWVYGPEGLNVNRKTGENGSRAPEDRHKKGEFSK